MKTKIKPDTKVTFSLPCVVGADDYHEFGYQEDFLREVMGTKKIYVEEIGFSRDRNEYLALVHTGLKRHLKLHEALHRELDAESGIMAWPEIDE
jgi:hypothetical protein